MKELKKFALVLLPCLVAGVCAALIFGINSVLDGYGDGRLMVYYLFIFVLASILLGLVLHLYSRIRKFESTLQSNIFLLCSAVVALILFIVIGLTTAYVLKSIESLGFGASTRNFILLALFSFALSFVFFVWLTSRQGRTRQKVIFFFAVILVIAPLIFIYVNEKSVFGKKGRQDLTTPNILLLTIESFRYDHLGCNGNPRIQSPNIDAVAGKGVSFDNYFVQAGYTTASLPTLMTGLYPFHHKGRTLGMKPDPKYAPFVEELDKRGYTVKIDANFFPLLFPKSARFDDKTISLYHSFYDRLTRLQYYINDRLGDVMPSVFSRYCFGSNTSMIQTSKLLQRLRFNHDKSFFFWVHFIKNCHIPYSAAPEFIAMYNENHEDIKTDWSYQDVKHLSRNPDKITDEVMKGLDITYCAEVSCIDRQIGMIMNHLERLNLLDKTVVIISADHGELLGERGFIGHGRYLVDDLIRVPLIFFSESRDIFKGGKRISELVEEVDIAPTVMDICAVDPVQEIDGNSLLDILESRGWNKRSIYCEIGSSACFRTKEYKLIWDFEKNTFILYDIAADPGETEDLIEIMPEVAERLKVEWLDFTKLGKLNDLRSIEEPVLDEDMKEKLKSLGYID
jgi:arylsulfatase A-like enzyme